MKNWCVVVFLVLAGSAVYGQRKPSKEEVTAAKLVGVWKFDYAVYSTNSPFTGEREKTKSDVFHTDTIYFFVEGTFRFRSAGTMEPGGRVHTGNWEIAERGRVLIHKNRSAAPPFDEPTPDLRFPLKMINDNRIRIDYVFRFVDDTTKEKERVPVFFNRVP